MKQLSWIPPATALSMRRLVFVLLVLPAVSGCYREPTRWDAVQEKTRHNAPAVAKEAVPGASFNKLFPKPSGDFDVIYSAKKRSASRKRLW